jgi:hypothetical protein
VSSSADVAAALADPQPGLVVEALVGAAVPTWLPRALAQVRAAGFGFAVTLSPQTGRTPESAAGWEVGVLATVLGLGVDEVHGADPVRLRRVQAVIDHLAGG